MQAHDTHLLLGPGPSHRRDNTFPSLYRLFLGAHCVSHTVLGPGTPELPEGHGHINRNNSVLCVL